MWVCKTNPAGRGKMWIRADKEWEFSWGTDHSYPGGRKNFSSPPFPTLSLQSLTDFDLELPSSSSTPAWTGCLGHYLSTAQIPPGSLCLHLPGSGNKTPLRQKMKPPRCGYFSSFPFVHLQEPVVAPGNKSPSLGGALTWETPKSLLFRCYKFWTPISRTTLLSQSPWLNLHTAKSWWQDSHSMSTGSIPMPSKKAGRVLQSSPSYSTWAFHRNGNRARYSPASQGLPPLQWASKTMHIWKEALRRKWRI